MIQTIGVRIAGPWRVRVGGVRLRSVVGVIGGNQGGKRFATWKHCRAEPEDGPCRHQPHTRESAKTPWPSDRWPRGRTSCR